MSLPKEFTKEYIEANTGKNELYSKFLKSGEPYKSLNQRNVHVAASEGYFPAGTLDLNDESLYYNTSGEASTYWKHHELPMPTKDITKLRADLEKWGYCIIEEALSKKQLACMQKRTEEQAAGERKAGIATWTAGKNKTS